MDAPVENEAKSTLENTAAEPRDPCHLVDRDILATSLPDKAESLGELAIFDCENLGRLPYRDSAGIHPQGLGGRFFALHHAMQERGSLVTDLEMAGPDTGKRGIGDLAKSFVVIHAYHRDFIRHQCARPATSFQEIQSPLVAADHHSGGFGEGMDPGSELVFLLLPSRAVSLMSRKLVDFRLIATRPKLRLKCLPPPHGPILVFNTEKGEGPEAAFKQMLDGKVSDQLVIDMHEGNVSTGDYAQNIYRGEPCARDSLRDTLCLKAGNNPITLPVAEPFRDGLLKAARLMIEGPPALLATELCDSAKDVTPGSQGGLNKQGHVRSIAGGGWRFGHEVPRWKRETQNLNI